MMRRAGNVAKLRSWKTSIKFWLVDLKGSLKRPRRGWKDNIKMDMNEKVVWV
jgi:hypothetical protein